MSLPLPSMLSYSMPAQTCLLPSPSSLCHFPITPPRVGMKRPLESDYIPSSFSTASVACSSETLPPQLHTEPPRGLLLGPSNYQLLYTRNEPPLKRAKTTPLTADAAGHGRSEIEDAMRTRSLPSPPLAPQEVVADSPQRTAYLLPTGTTTYRRPSTATPPAFMQTTLLASHGLAPAPASISTPSEPTAHASPTKGLMHDQTGSPARKPALGGEAKTDFSSVRITRLADILESGAIAATQHAEIDYCGLLGLTVDVPREYAHLVSSKMPLVPASEIATMRLEELAFHHQDAADTSVAEQLEKLSKPSIAACVKRLWGKRIVWDCHTDVLLEHIFYFDVEMSNDGRCTVTTHHTIHDTGNLDKQRQVAFYRTQVVYTNSWTTKPDYTQTVIHIQRQPTSSRHWIVRFASDVTSSVHPFARVAEYAYNPRVYVTRYRQGKLARLGKERDTFEDVIQHAQTSPFFGEAMHKENCIRDEYDMAGRASSLITRELCEDQMDAWLYRVSSTEDGRKPNMLRNEFGLGPIFCGSCVVDPSHSEWRVFISRLARVFFVPPPFLVHAIFHIRHLFASQ